MGNCFEVFLLGSGSRPSKYYDLVQFCYKIESECMQSMVWFPKELAGLCREMQRRRYLGWLTLLRSSDFMMSTLTERGEFLSKNFSSKDPIDRILFLDLIRYYLLTVWKIWTTISGQILAST